MKEKAKVRLTNDMKRVLNEQALAFYRQRGTTSTIRHIVLVKVERAMPLISPAYDQGKTEEEIRNTWLGYWETLYHHTS